MVGWVRLYESSAGAFAWNVGSLWNLHVASPHVWTDAPFTQGCQVGADLRSRYWEPVEHRCSVSGVFDDEGFFKLVRTYFFFTLELEVKFIKVFLK